MLVILSKLLRVIFPIVMLLFSVVSVRTLLVIRLWKQLVSATVMSGETLGFIFSFLISC